MGKKLNYIDYAIIGIMIVLIIISGSKVYNSRRNKALLEQISKRMSIVLRLENVESYYQEALNKGDKVYSQEKDSYLGDISEIWTENSHTILIKNNGEITRAKTPEKYDIYLNIDSNILVKEDGYFAEGITELLINSFEDFKTPRVAFSALIENIIE